MSLPNLQMVKGFLTNPRFFLGKDCILLLSHMRGKTSLLSHILGSHPDIEGYYEMHASYQWPGDMRRQKAVYLSEHGVKKTSKVFLDKILHNRHQLSDDLLTSPSTRVVFMVRQPEETLLSTVSLYAKKTEKQIYAEPEHATEYYVKRLERLVKHATLLQKNYFYLDAEALTKSPQATLADLGDWLGLSEPLNAEYNLFKKTGATGAGDSSKNITSGRIVETRSDYKGPEIPTELLDRAQAAFDECRSVLLANCARSATS